MIFDIIHVSTEGMTAIVGFISLVGIAAVAAAFLGTPEGWPEIEQ